VVSIAAVCRNLGQQLLDHAAVLHAELAPDQIGGLHAVGAFVDRGDPHVAIVLGDAGFLDEAHAAMDLHGKAGHLDANVGAP
jgi:hypothetical protein